MTVCIPSLNCHFCLYMENILKLCYMYTVVSMNQPETCFLFSCTEFTYLPKSRAFLAQSSLVLPKNKSISCPELTCFAQKQSISCPELTCLAQKQTAETQYRAHIQKQCVMCNINLLPLNFKVSL